MGDRRGAYRVFFGGGGDGREGDHFEDLFLHDRIILKQIFKKWDGEAWIYLAQVAGACECGNESSRSIKFGEFLDKLRTG